MNVLPLGRAVELLRTGELPPRSVVITFDDGFYDFYAKALPILGRFGYPSVLYLTTYYCLHPRPLFRLTLSYLLWKGRHFGTLNLHELVGRDESVSVQDGYSRDRLVKRLSDYAATNKLSPDAKVELLRRLSEGFGLSFDDLCRRRILQLMSPEEVVAARDSGVEIALHTHRHRTPDDSALFRRELEDNSSAIQELTGQRSVHFCYPSGVVKSGFLPWLRDFEVKSATTCERGLVSARTEPLLMPRILDDCQMTPAAFEGWLTGFNALIRDF
jgi:peptidoglycan/xylan/chitin deacetylase (PgdA/CDA1 family)